MPSGEVTLKEALERVEGTNLKGRSEGIADLKHILRSNTKFTSLSDKAFHSIYEVLFRIAISEQSTHLKAKTTTTRSAAENRLSACASTLRLAVEVGVRFLKLKTVRALLDHLIQTLLLPNGTFCEPLAVDYARCLKALCSYQAIVEHLNEHDRERIALFCIECIKNAGSELADDDTVPGAEAASTHGAINGISYRSSRSQIKESSESQGSRSLARQIAGETVACLSLLTSAPNATYGKNAEKLLSCLIETLKNSAIGSLSHHDAFAAINHILAWSRTENMELTRKVVSPLVRLLRHYWSVKPSVSLKEEMLITWIHLRSYIFAALRQDTDAALRSELSNTLDVMKNEYVHWKDREHMRMEDLSLELDTGKSHSSNICMPIFRLRSIGPRAETSWTTIYIMASLCNALSRGVEEDISSEDEEEDAVNQRPRKRQRLTDEFEEILNSSATGSVASRTCALQMLAFLAQQKSFSGRQLVKAIAGLSATCAEENATLSTWAILGLASFASQADATAACLSMRWLSVWQLASRAMSNAVTCRQACYLLFIMLTLRLVPQSNVSELVQAMSASMDLNGPSMLADSVTKLLAFVVKQSQQISPASASTTAESTLTWLLRNFLPSKFEDKTYSVQNILFESGDVVDLVACCLGQAHHTTNSLQAPIWNSIGEAWLACAAQQDLVAYLLLSPQSQTVADFRFKRQDASPSASQPRALCEVFLLNHLISELHKTQEAWNVCVQDNPQGISSDMFASLCKACTISACIASCSSLRDTRRQGQLQRQVQRLLKSLSDFVAGLRCTQEKVDLMLAIFSASCSNPSSRETVSSCPECEILLCRTIHDGVEARKRNRELDSQDNDEDPMDWDDAHESQDSKPGEQLNGMGDYRNEFAVRFSNLALRSSVPLHAAVVTLQSASSDSDRKASLSGIITDHILDQPVSSILAGSKAISTVEDLGVDISSHDAERILDFFTSDVLSAYHHERNEVALNAILDIMSSLAPLWTDASHETLYNLGLDIYSWFTTTALSAGVLSPGVQQRVASLLLQLCHVDTEYGNAADVPSVRTSLFKVLQLGSISVQFHMANRISTIFGLFILSNHSAMFDDLQMSLTSDPLWIEGMSMRLLIFSKLASAWHSLLRQCVFYIFETAGRVEGTALYAARGIRELSQSLQFKSPRKLFHLFAPQLLHSWLESNRVTDLPFAVFEYESLGALIAQNEAEITAQLLMHGNDEGIQIVTKVRKTTSRELVTMWFAKCAAYCLSWDVATPPSKAGGDTAESRLRALVGGKEEHRRLAAGHFAAIMGQFYLSLNQDDAQDKWLENRREYGSAASALLEIKNISHSERTLPGSQQPSFRSRNLCDQIERLCRRTGHDPTNPWEGPSLSVALRIIFDCIDDALGSQHTCLMIRRLRLLIAMAGDVALSGVPVIMLIHTVRPFLSNSECADDTMGIIQYVFQRGAEYLKTDFSFVYGTATLMILQMRKHASAKQDSTTQGSQHKDTVQRMEKLHTWLVHYLQKLGPPNTSLTSECSSLAKSLAHIQLPGNARSGSPESALLLILLRQHGTARSLLQQNDRDEALAMLSHGFELPGAVSEDCLEREEDCVRVAPQLWRSMQSSSLSESFTVWAARVLGRAYVSTGSRPLANYGVLPSSADGSTQYEGISRSRSKIAQRLSKSFFSRHRAEASIADYTLRTIVPSFIDPTDCLSFEQMLPSAIAAAVEDGTYGYQPTSASTSISDPNASSSLNRILEPDPGKALEPWVQELSVHLCQNAKDVDILPALTVAIQNIDGLALDLFPCIVHILLARDLRGTSTFRAQLSASLIGHLEQKNEAFLRKQRFLLELVLYLRGQALPGETTQADRLRWLEVDWLMAAQAADECGMPTAAILFAESASQPSQGNKRASLRASMSQVSIAEVSDQLLLSMFKRVDEPDSFYGVEQSASLNSVLERSDYEGDGLRSLMLRSAQADNDLRRSHAVKDMDASGMIHSLSLLNLNSLTFALLSGGLSAASSSQDLFDSARRLQQWDIVPPESSSELASNIFIAFQELSRATDRSALQDKIRSIMVSQVSATIHDHASRPSLQWFSALASLVEMDEVIGLSGQSAIRSNWHRMRARQSWMEMGRFDDFRSILTNRNTLFNVLVQNKSLSAAMGIGVKDCRTIEIETLLDISRFARGHNQPQEALAAASQIGDLLSQCKDLGLKVDAAANFETASVLWSSDEVAASVKMLRDTIIVSDLEHQDIPVGRSGLEAQLAHQLAEARLEAPDDILSKYLKPAINHLQGRNEGLEAGTVFSEFASFCDKQLQNPGNIEDYNRIAKLRQAKLEEVHELERLPNRSKLSAAEKKKHDKDISTAKSWLDIDNANFDRLKASRDTFLQQSLQNYLLALRASDEHDISILRFFALWLENSETAEANEVVSKYLSGVPSWKFVVLMNQLMSRLEQDGSAFQKALQSLATRICSEHPHHSLHHLYATTRQPESADPAARSRYEVATKIRRQLANDPQRKELLANVFKADNSYEAVARFDTNESRSLKVALKDIRPAYDMSKAIPQLQVPPATISIALRPDGDYHGVPVVVRFSATLSIMSGLSHPKKVTAYASNGVSYSQLLKHGDDLRQDAIMEQVFEEVSKMLRNHQATRQRNLHVRTYKVIPLTSQSGIIEFVANSTSFSDFLVSAHERYYPQDYKNNKARQIISTAKDHSTEIRVKEYRKLCDHMHPVMRHFFFERYNDPDEWFEKRTAYTRTTATISILGYVLGLGDRHCQNIMLDEKTGEVVHIDLGVAFEAGRVLPIPELVPFRLTRDVIDGMGITKTEGVFRRCCEFTMDSLREDKDSIMTLLNVLRYDPLYSWSVSPLRAKRMQEETGRNATKAEATEGSSKKREQEAGEADRALSIVEKKLLKTLSTAANVNELIQQATDERNLATLFSGWSAWF